MNETENDLHASKKYSFIQQHLLNIKLSKIRYDPTSGACTGPFKVNACSVDFTWLSFLLPEQQLAVPDSVL